MNSSKEQLENLKKKRDENFKKLGQLQLQKEYYEKEIKNLLECQKELYYRIVSMEKNL